MGEIIAAFLSDHCLVFGTCPCGKQPSRRESLKYQGRPCVILLVYFLHGIPMLGFTKMMGIMDEFVTWSRRSSGLLLLGPVEAARTAVIQKLLR